MRDLARTWNAGGMHKSVFVRSWSWFSWRTFWRVLTGGKIWSAERFECSLRCFEGGNHRCYCPGRVIDFRIAFLDVGVWLSYSIDRNERPCYCDKVMAELFPETYADGE